MDNRIDIIAKSIFEWIQTEYDDGNGPYYYGADDSDMTIGVDGNLDCRKLAAAIDKALTAALERPPGDDTPR